LAQAKDDELLIAREKMEILRLETFKLEKEKILEGVKCQLAQETLKMAKNNELLLETAKMEILREKNLALDQEKRIFTDQKNLEAATMRDEIVKQKDAELKIKTKELLQWMQAEVNQEKSKLENLASQVEQEKKKVENLETAHVSLENEKNLLLCQNKFDEKLVTAKQKILEN
jgi:hypothetical protein